MTRAGVVDDVLHLRLGEAGVDGHGDRAGQLRAPEGEHPVEAVGQPDRDAVAALEPGGPQASGDPRCPVPQLP